jgi:L-aminopeptidase/D-esterase-like protein
MRLSLALLLLFPVALAAQSGTPVARVNPGGPALTFDFPGMRIGVAEYDEGPTGTTVFYFPGKVVGVVDVRGGAPGTIMTDALRLANRDRRLDGVVFSGGSAYGLAAATGAAAALKPQRVRDGQWGSAAWFAGAIIYDIWGRRLSTVTPDEALGIAALNAAVEGRFPLGARGAGRSAMQGYFFADSKGDLRDWPHSGQGGAFRQVGPTKIAVFTVVNAIGAVVDRRGRLVRCSYVARQEDCGTIEEALARRLPKSGTPSVAGREDGAENTSGLSSNTTITLVVTNQKLEVRELQRLAIQVHGSMARGIQPYSTTEDGDALFAVTTAEVENPSLSAMDLSTIASEVAWDAILASVPPPDPARPTTPIRVSTSDLDAVVGKYEFPSGASVAVRREGEQLRTTLTGSGGIFFAATGNTLVPVAPREFLIEGSRNDRVLFDVSGGRVAAMTLNPGQWGQRAKRVP